MKYLIHGTPQQPMETYKRHSDNRSVKTQTSGSEQVSVSWFVFPISDDLSLIFFLMQIQVSTFFLGSWGVYLGESPVDPNYLVKSVHFSLS